MSNHRTHVQVNKIESDPASAAATRHHQRKWLKATAVIVLSLLIILAVGAFWLARPPLTAAKQKILAAVPFPMMLVNGQPVSARDFLNDLAIIKQLALRQNYTLSDGQLKSLTYNQLVSNVELAQVAHNHGVWIGSKELNTAYNSRAAATSPDLPSFNAILAGYSLSPDDYRRLAVEPSLLQTNLQIWFYTQENLNQKEYTLAKSLVRQIQGGADMGALAKTYTQDAGSQATQGDLGFVEVAQLLPEMQEAADSMKTGDVSTIPSRYGLHIVKLLQKDNSGPGGANRIHLQQIFLQGQGYQDWYNSEINKIKIINIITM